MLRLAYGLPPLSPNSGSMPQISKYRYRDMHGVQRSPPGECARIARGVDLTMVSCLQGQRPKSIESVPDADTTKDSVVLHIPATAKPAMEHGKPVVWLYLAGHTRTLLLNAPRLKSFLSTMTPNWFVSICVWDEIEVANLNSLWWTDKASRAPRPDEYPPLRSVLEDVMCAFEGRAAAQAIRRGTKSEQTGGGQANLWSRTHNLAEAAARRMGVPLSKGDIVIKSRPDVLFAHAIDAVSLARHFRSRPRTVFALQHEGFSVPADNDPSEVVWVTSRQGYGAQMEHGAKHGFSYEAILFGQGLGLNAAYLRPDFTIAINRLTGWLPDSHKCRNKTECWRNGASLATHVTNPMGGMHASGKIPRGPFLDPCDVRPEDPVSSWLMDVARWVPILRVGEGVHVGVCMHVHVCMCVRVRACARVCVWQAQRTQTKHPTVCKAEDKTPKEEP